VTTSTELSLLGWEALWDQGKVVVVVVMVVVVVEEEEEAAVVVIVVVVPRLTPHTKSIPNS